MLDLVKGGMVLFAAVFNFLIAFAVLLRNPRKLVNLVYFTIVFAFFLWCVSLFFYEFPFIFSSLFWIKATYFVAIIYLGMVFPFSFIFPQPSFRRIWPVAAIVGLGYFIFSFWLLFFTKAWVIDVIIDPVKGQQTVLGWAYIWWVFAGWFIALWMVVNFILKTKHAVKVEKFQMYYFWIGYILYAVGVSLIDVVLPLIFHDTRFFIYSPATSLFFSGAIAYAILKHRFMDIHLLIARSVSYFLLILSFGIFYSLSLILSTTFLIKELISINSYFVFTFFAVIIAFSFQPLLAFFQKITDKVFYKQHYDETKVLYDSALIMASTINLSELTDKLLGKILAELHISGGSFVLIDDKKIFHFNCQGLFNRQKFSEKEIELFIKQKEIAIFDELPDGELKEAMRRLKASIILPLRSKEEHEDVLLLGEKLSGNPYTNQDIKFLKVFGSTAAVAIKNASNVEHIMRLDELKSEFITVVSHQLRTPLSVARWNFELILEKVFGEIPPKVEEITRNTYRALMGLNKGLNNLMTVLEIEEGDLTLRREKINFERDVIAETLNDLKREIENKKVVIENKISLPEFFEADRKKIKMVFETILDNAIRYSPLGAKIIISGFAQEKGGKKELLISVDDEGIGILPKNRETIFTKFFRGEDAKRISPDGFGLGLFMAQKYVRAHGGELWFEKKKGPGSIFSFNIPLK